MTLFLQFDMDRDHWDIMVESPGMRPMPAGPRLFRGPPHPDVEFAHARKGDAQAAIVLLNQYFATIQKGPTKKELREAGI